MERRCASFLALACLFLLPPRLHAQEWVKFPGTIEDGKPLELAGILTMPRGDGPFPAVVLLHVCDGIREPGTGTAAQMTGWARRLADWGYVTLQVDSLGPRSIADGCASQESWQRFQTLDAFAAKAWLATRRQVDPGRIGVVGWSSGGIAVIAIVDAFGRAKGIEPFKAAIAFYPMCSSFSMRDTPLLILIGELDYHNARRCETRSDQTLNGAAIELTLKVYPNTYHAFDYEGLNETMENGWHLEYNAEATQDAIVRTRDSLARHLQNK
jgi:dienelactone hydrolase